VFVLNENTIKDLIADLEAGRHEQASRYPKFLELFGDWKICIHPDFKGMETQEVQDTYESWGGNLKSAGTDKVQVYIERPAWGYYESPTGNQQGVKYNAVFGKVLVLDEDCPSCDVGDFQKMLTFLKGTAKNWSVPSSLEVQEIVAEIKEKFSIFDVSYCPSGRVYIKKQGETLDTIETTKYWRGQQNLPTFQELENKFNRLVAAKEKAVLDAAKSADLAQQKQSAKEIEKAEQVELRELLKARKQRQKTGAIAKPAEVKRLRELCQKYPNIY
jgi:hypothetical protein